MRDIQKYAFHLLLRIFVLHVYTSNVYFCVMVISFSCAKFQNKVLTAQDKQHLEGMPNITIKTVMIAQVMRVM